MFTKPTKILSLSLSQKKKKKDTHLSRSQVIDGVYPPGEKTCI